MEKPKDNSLSTGILKQCFNQLPTEGKVHLKEYIQNLISLQSTMVAPLSEDNTLLSSKDDCGVY